MGDRVRLLEAYEGFRAGSLGAVSGFYRRQSGEQIAVLLDNGRSLPIPIELLQLLSEPTPLEHEERSDVHSARLTW